MSSLSVPQRQTSGKSINRSSSASSLRIEHDDDLVPLSRSRRNSDSNAAATPTANVSSTGNAPTPAAPAAATPSTAAAPSTTLSPSAAAAPSAGAPGSAAAQAGLVPLPQWPMQSQAENSALTAPVDWKESDHLQATEPHSEMTCLYIGKNKKPCHVRTALLTEQSPYLKKLLTEDTGHDGKITSTEQTTFEDLDEFAMSLFMHWNTANGHLNGPHDFHSLAHYLGLYVLARKFEIESLENQGRSSPVPLLTRPQLTPLQSWTWCATTTPTK